MVFQNRSQMASIIDLVNRSIIVVVCSLTYFVAGWTELSAVTNYNVIPIYERVKNEESPSELDPATEDAATRRRICKDITKSGYFYWEMVRPLKMRRNIHRQLRKPEYLTLFRQIYTPTSEGQSHSYEYTNLFTSRHFHAIDGNNRSRTPRRLDTTEFVFLCLMEDNEINPIYVSKEYSLSEEFNVPVRFLFEKSSWRAPANIYLMRLAEQASTVFEEPNYNVELHYLEIRGYRHPVENKDEDPVCKLMSLEDTKNQSYRLCAEIYGSDYFKGKLKFPMPWIHHECEKREVSFRTAEGIVKSNGNVYHEFMTPCQTRIRGSSEKAQLYVSRAYKRNEVFVYKAYRRSNRETKYYLKKRIINVNIVHEVLSFDDVE